MRLDAGAGGGVERLLAVSAIDLTAHPFFTGLSGREWSVGPQFGCGGTAVVFEVTSEDGLAGAAKVLSAHRIPVSDEMVERFRREGDHLRDLEHPHVIRVLDSAVVADAPVLILEPAATSLNEVVRQRDAPVPVPDALSWLLQAAAGLHAVGEAGLVHRDLSLKNLLLRADGSLAVADFGTVLSQEDVTITKGEGLGSLVFISAQQFEDAHKATPADDVYSLGQVGYYVLTGRSPFGGPPSVTGERHEVPQPLASLMDGMRMYERSRRPCIDSVLVDLVRFSPYIGLGESPPVLGGVIETQLARIAEDRGARLGQLPMEGRGSAGVDPVWAAAHEAYERARVALEVSRGDLSNALVDVYCDHCGNQGAYLARERLPCCGACGRDALTALGQPAGDGFPPKAP